MKKLTVFALCLIFAAVWLSTAAVVSATEPTTKFQIAMVPTSEPTKAPTQAPSQAPSQSPSQSPTPSAVPTTERKNLSDAMSALQSDDKNYQDIVGGIVGGITDIGGTINGAFNTLIEGAGQLDFSAMKDLFGKLTGPEEGTTNANGKPSAPNTPVMPNVTLPSADNVQQSLGKVFEDIGNSNGLLSGIFSGDSQGLSGGLSSVLGSFTDSLNNASGGNTSSQGLLGALGSLGSLGSIFSPGNQAPATTIPQATVPTTYNYSYIGNANPTPVTPVTAAPTAPTTEPTTLEITTQAFLTDAATEPLLIQTAPQSIVGDDTAEGRSFNSKKIIGAVLVIASFGAIAAIIIKKAM